MKSQFFLAHRVVTGSTLLMVIVSFALSLFPRLAITAQAAAQLPSTTILTQQDLDNDGQLDLTVLAAAFATASDRVLVYDGGRNMQPGTVWKTAVDLHDDTWLFDQGGDGSIELVLRFEKYDGRTIALLYTDQDGDQHVSVASIGSTLAITEPGFPPLRAEVEGDWFLPGGELNWNIRFATDGPVVNRHTFELTEVWQRRQDLVLDGLPDVELIFADHDRDGVPEYGIWRLLAPTSRGIGSMRTWLWSNEGRHRPSQPEGALFWPYLATHVPSALKPGGAAPAQRLNYFDVPAIVEFDFATAALSALTFRGYPVEHGFHVHTLEYFSSKQVNYANFENIQAYYDLAADQDGTPELHIRHRYYEAGDPAGGGLQVPTNEIRWSWSQQNKLRMGWDFKLGLAGRHTITSETRVGDYQYKTVPYDTLPAWVNTQHWDFATFVAVERQPYVSSEGVYSWAPLESRVDGDITALSRYLNGAEITIDHAFQSIPEGLRGEFAPDFHQQPALYFSPIDGKLHLLKAQRGVWSVSPQKELRYANLDGDAYLDQWRSFEEGKLVGEVNATRDYIIYAGGNELMIKAARIEPALFEVQPPENKTMWQALGAQMAEARTDYEPDDLQAMVRSLAGPALIIQNAHLRNYRPLPDNGFRFVLSIAPGYTITGDDSIGLAGYAPGDYVVSYTGASFSVTPLVAPHLAVSLRTSIATQLESGLIELTLRNDGLEDVTTATLELQTIAPDSTAPTVITRTVTLLAGERLDLQLPWTPLTYGLWNLTARLQPAEFTPIETLPYSVEVQPAQLPDLPTIIERGGARGSILGGLGGLLSIVLLIYLVAWSALSMPNEKREGHEG